MNLHAQMPYVRLLTSGPEAQSPRSLVLLLQITAERRQGKGNLQCHKFRFLLNKIPVYQFLIIFRILLLEAILMIHVPGPAT